MYWCKKGLLFIGGFILLQNLLSCKGDSRAGAMKFFDLKGYFTNEAARLTRLNPEINKTAVYNKQSETKKVHITNWSTELSIFSESDINKPAWRGSYKRSDAEGITTYTAIDTTLKTQYIIVKKQGDKVKLISIFNHTKTTLFGKSLHQTWENLVYVPDSLYRIQKKQYTRILGFNNYFIKGTYAQ
jgi:hypothetical protein